MYLATMPLGGCGHEAWSRWEAVLQCITAPAFTCHTASIISTGWTKALIGPRMLAAELQQKSKRSTTSTRNPTKCSRRAVSCFETPHAHLAARFTLHRLPDAIVFTADSAKADTSAVMTAK